MTKPRAELSAVRTSASKVSVCEITSSVCEYQNCAAISVCSARAAYQVLNNTMATAPTSAARYQAVFLIRSEKADAGAPVEVVPMLAQRGSPAELAAGHPAAFRPADLQKSPASSASFVSTADPARCPEHRNHTSRCAGN